MDDNNNNKLHAAQSILKPRNSPHFMESEGSLVFTKACYLPSSEPDEYSRRPTNFLKIHFNIIILPTVCRDSAVGTATRYGLDGPRIESRWGARFSAPVQTGPGAHPASYTMGTGSFLKVKRPGSGNDHPPPSGAEVEGRIELYICSPSGSSWPVIG